MTMTKPFKYGIALTVALGMFLAMLDATIVSVALIPISKAVHTTFDSIQWIFIGYLLANAAVEVLSGYLGNRLGTKPVYLLGMAIFTVASVLCGLAPDEAWLIALRVVQGIGGGVLLPLGTAIAFESVSKNERAKVTAIVGVPLLLAPVVGPIIGGWIVDNLNWQAIFLVNLPLGLLAFGLTWWLLPADLIRPTEMHEKARFDYVSLLLSTAGVIVLVYALKLVSQTNPDTVSPANPAGDVYGWSYGLVWLLLGISAILLTSFAVVSLHKIDPVLDLRQFKRRNFTMSNLVNWLSTIVNYGVLALIPQFLQSIHTPNLSAIDTGLALAPMGLATLIGIVIAASLYEKIGALVSSVGGWFVCP